MRKQKEDPAALSSIALLQERFKKLEREKEMREEREVRQRLPFFMELERPSSSAINFEQEPKWFFHSDLVRPSPKPLHCPPSHRGNNKHADQKELQDLHIASSSSPPSSMAGEETDIDTSLHL